jgi:hypothetical protein
MRRLRPSGHDYGSGSSYSHRITFLIEPDAALAPIVAAEMQAALTFPVRVIDFKPSSNSISADGCVPVALSISAKFARNLLPENADLITLELRSARQSLATYLPASTSSGRNCLRLAELSEECAHHAHCCRIRSREPVATRHLASRVAARAKAGGSRHLRFMDCAEIERYFASSFPLLADSSLRELRQYEDLIRRPI